MLRAVNVVSCELSEKTTVYTCPGEKRPVSRSIHLGRLARCFPACRECSHRRDTGTLSRRTVRKLAEAWRRPVRQSLFHDEGVGGVWLNDMHPRVARDLAAAMGICLQRRLIADDEGRTDIPSVVIGGDGRPAGGPMVAALAEGLLWAGCNVVDIGPASAPCTAFAVDHLQAGGAVLLGNPTGRAETVGLKFWAPGARPLSAGGALDVVRATWQEGTDRPSRRFGSLRRFQADVPYLESLAGHYHALRPLRLAVDTSCKPVLRYLGKLITPVACRLVTEETHLAVRIDDDGETCCVTDEQGRRVPDERLLMLIIRHLVKKKGPGPIVLQEDTPASVVEELAALGCTTVTAGRRRADMERAMRQHGALFGSGGDGRFWYAATGTPLPDALTTLTHLLVLLSQSDRPLSEVLDRRATAR